MSRWFRHYAGMVRDDKLVRAALHSKQSIERVIWVYSAILESAAEINDEGRFDFDTGEAAYFLRADEDELRTIVASLEACGRIAESRVVRWKHRQFISDSSAERVRRHRAKQKQPSDGVGEQQENDTDRNSNDAVTLRNAPETETETETETEIESLAPLARAEPSLGVPAGTERSAEDEFWSLTDTAEKNGLSRSRLGQIASLYGGEFEAALAALNAALRSKNPSAYLGKVVSNLRAESEPNVLPMKPRRGEPEFVRAFRAEGYSPRRTETGRWRVGGEIYDDDGRVVGF
jgi:hypothetical protein